MERSDAFSQLRQDTIYPYPTNLHRYNIRNKEIIGSFKYTAVLKYPRAITKKNMEIGFEPFITCSLFANFVINSFNYPSTPTLESLLFFNPSDLVLYIKTCAFYIIS